MFEVLLFSAMVFAGNQAAHVHGAGHVRLAFDGAKGKIQLETPGQALFGFEHEAKSKKDKSKKEAALQKLESKISEMIVFDSALNCEIKKEIFEVNQKNGHADVSAEFSVQCQQPVVGSSISFHFPKVFTSLKSVQVDALADDVQKSLVVKKNGDSIGLK